MPEFFLTTMAGRKTLSGEGFQEFLQLSFSVDC